MSRRKDPARRAADRPRRRAPGDCASVAWGLVVDDPDRLVLCHGEPRGRGPENRGVRYFHAWAETIDGATVIDRSNGLDVTMDTFTYYALGRIDRDRVRRYTASEARRLARETGEYGPWEG